LLHQRLSRMQAEDAGAIATLDLLHHAVWLLDGHGRVILTNRAGRELDAQRDGIWIGLDDKPSAALPEERHALDRSIARAIAAGAGRSMALDGMVAIRRRRQEHPLQALVYPLGSDVLLRGAAAALFIFDPARPPLIDSHALQVLYQLTRAEAQLAVALARGMNLQEYGAAQQISANTVRTHLRRVLTKTGTHQQSQLVSLVGRLATMTG
jgi:DNA-binding CsgD family transcriptional regulator